MASPGEPSPDAALVVTPPPMGRLVAYGLAVVTGLLYWLAFPGKMPLGRWHGLLSLVAFVPMWVAVQRQPPKRALLIGLIVGTTMNLAGFTWLLDMLEVFGGFPAPICMFFAVLVCTYQGGRLGLMGWLHGRAAARGWPPAAVFVAAFGVSELAYPLLFPWYFAATAYELPALSQTADLAGPILPGAILCGVSVALAEPLLARLERRAMKPLRLAVPLAALGAALVYAAVRIPSVDRTAQAGEPVHVGIAQGNLGLIQKRDDPAEALRRHVQLTEELKERGAQMVVWSESSVTMLFPERGYANMMKELFTRAIGVPAIIGTVLYSEGGLGQSLYNTALSIDARGDVTGRYDKEYLLAFGEYLPFGEMFPKLYDWSPNSGRFTPGTVVDPLPITIDGMTHPVGTLICYEDVVPRFVNKVVSHGHPELLVNMSNDAWFGDTAEPWEHLALAQLRAIEHRRYLVRSTNSGVSAIVDPVGRVMVHSGTFDVEGLDAVVHWLHGSTVYETLGDGPWMLLGALLVFAAFVDRRRLRRAAPAGGAMLLALSGCSSSSAAPAKMDATASDVFASDVVDTGAVDAGVDTGFDAGPCPALIVVSFGGPNCNTCAANLCCATGTACYAAADGGVGSCALLANCIADCEGAAGDAGGPDAEPGCIAGCDGEYGDASAPYAGLEACLSQKCANDAGTGPCN